MSRVFVCGSGAVSPAGWTVPLLLEALKQDHPLPVQPIIRPGWDKPLQVCGVPRPVQRLSFLEHPRLRRSSPLTHYAAAAAFEATGGLQAERAGRPRFGCVLCLQSGCVQYACRFLEEVRKDPALASPLLFPETVLGAPASHVAALLENTVLSSTLMGDSACFLQGVALAVTWLESAQADVCVVIGTEENNWLLADALWHFEHATVLSAGAGAVALTLDPALSVGVELSAITDAHTYTRAAHRARAARRMRAQLPLPSPAEVLCEGSNGSPRADAPERAAWQDWTGPRLAPKRVLGEGLMAAAAWQCVVACDGVENGGYKAANLSLVGCNHQAIGARFVRCEPGARARPGGATDRRTHSS